MEIELFKFWSEYTDEEKKQLPPLNPQKVSDGEADHYVWDGKDWIYLPF